MKVRISITQTHIIAFILLVFFLLGIRFLEPTITGAIVLPPSGNLSCFSMQLLNNSCPAGYTKLLGMSNTTNAHAEAPNETNYNFSVCCRDLTGTNTIGNGNGTALINLSNFTNAHAETPTAGNYNVPLRINASNASIGCSINETGAGTCPTDFTCITTLSNTTNAHVANCSAAQAYNVTVCCSIGALITRYLHPTTAPTNNLTANGSINGTLVNGTETSYQTQTITYINASSGNKRFLEFVGNFNLSTVDARTLVVQHNNSGIAADLSGVSGKAATHTLFLNRTLNNLGVHLCPSANTLAQIVPSCAGELNFSGPFPQTQSGVTVSQDSTDYRIADITGSGAELLVMINSRVTNTTFTNSTAIGSTIENSTMDSSAITGSNVTNTTATNSTIVSSTKINTTMTNSTNINSDVRHSTETHTTFTTVNAVRCVALRTNIATSACDNSRLTDVTGSGWNIDPSNVTNSTCTGACTIENSNVSDSNITDSTVNNSNITFSTITNSEINNSAIHASNVHDLQVFDANITADFCFYGRLVFMGNTFICPIALSAVYSPPSTGAGGGSGSGAGAAAGAAAAASTSSAAAASAASASTASMSVTSVSSYSSPIQCATVPPLPTTEKPEIPRGYELIGQPTFTCFGNLADFTINLPDHYEDLKALRCRQKKCAIVQNVQQSNMQLPCGNTTLRDIQERELAKIRPILSVEVPVEVTADRYLSEANRRAVIGSYEVLLDGPMPSRFLAKISMQDVKAPLPPNPSVLLLTDPFSITFEENALLDASININTPVLHGIDLETLTIATYHRGQWILVGGTYDPETKKVSTTIQNIQQYFTNGKGIFALLGVVCDACTEGKLVRDYTDGTSRRALILVHGLTAHSIKFASIIDEFKLTNQPWQVWTYRYPYNRSIEENAHDLIDLISLHQADFDKIYILGHSLGGMITQQALRDAYDERQQGIERNDWLPKVRTAIIIGTPNQGSPTADVYKALLSNLFNLSTTASPFNVNSSVINDLAYGKSIQPIPGVDYQIMVGTRTIPFTKDLFGQQANDGVLTPESGSTLGQKTFRDSCKNYYAINITHVDLDDHPTAIKVVQRIINKDLNEERPDLALAGYNQYLRVAVSDCSPADSYFVIGKRISDQETFDPILCECGNRYCNVGETPENCPSDCVKFPWVAQSCLGIALLTLPGLLIAIIIVLVYAIRKHLLKRKTHPRIAYTVIVLVALATFMQPLACNINNSLAQLTTLALLAFGVIDFIIERRKPRSEAKQAPQLVQQAPISQPTKPQPPQPKAQINKPAPQQPQVTKPTAADEIIQHLSPEVKQLVKRTVHKNHQRVNTLLKMEQQPEVQKEPGLLTKARAKLDAYKQTKHLQQHEQEFDKLHKAREESEDIIKNLPPEVTEKMKRKGRRA